MYTFKYTCTNVSRRQATSTDYFVCPSIRLYVRRCRMTVIILEHLVVNGKIYNAFVSVCLFACFDIFFLDSCVGLPVSKCLTSLLPGKLDSTGRVKVKHASPSVPVFPST